MPVLRLLRATTFAVVCVMVSLGMHVLAGGATADPAVLAAAVPLITGGAFILARRQRGLGTLLIAAFAAQYGLHHLFSAAVVQPPPVLGHGHGGLAADLGMLLVHAVTALLSAYWLERGESALAMLLRLLVAAVVTLLVWRAAPAVRRLLLPPAGQDGARFVVLLLDAAICRRGPPPGVFAF
ncbi:hypothetical protein ACWDWV_35425 [Streptosporangium sandarakinum]